MSKIKFTGLQQLALFFNQLGRIKNFDDAYVGSAVEYGPFQEFGTFWIQERPHWRVAIPEVIAAAGSGGLKREMEESLMEAHGYDGLAAHHDEHRAFVERLALSMVESLFEAVTAGATSSEVDSGGNPPYVMALAIERRVKQVITAKKIIDTGNYRASVSAGRSEDEAYSKSVSRATTIDA